MNEHEHPIIFSGAMVRAILAGRKSMTRRLIRCNRPQQKHPPTLVHQEPVKGRHWVEPGGWVRPFARTGDHLWVKETFVYRTKHDRYYYRADHPVYDPYAHGGWRPSIFLPRSASRITLEVTSVRVERLQEITEESAAAEGVLAERECLEAAGATLSDNIPSAVRAFRYLWDEINGKRASWASNPWVWVISFKRVEPCTT